MNEKCWGGEQAGYLILDAGQSLKYQAAFKKLSSIQNQVSGIQH